MDSIVIIPNGWYVFVFLMISGSFTFFGYRIYQDRDYMSRSMIVKLLMSSILVLIMFITFLFQPTPT